MPVRSEPCFMAEPNRPKLSGVWVIVHFHVLVWFNKSYKLNFILLQKQNTIECAIFWHELEMKQIALNRASYQTFPTFCVQPSFQKFLVGLISKFFQHFAHRVLKAVSYKMDVVHIMLWHRSRAISWNSHWNATRPVGLQAQGIFVI